MLDLVINFMFLLDSCKRYFNVSIEHCHMKEEKVLEIGLM